ncbi:MAG: threonine ammonia-lyase [Rhodospirillales bacterium]
MSITIDNIRSAADALAGQVLRTPSIDSRVLSDLCGTEIVLKLENMQITGSFKPRGAYMKLTSLSDDERTAGVVAASAGNHAQGVAYHAHRLGIPATVYMPEATPFTKIARTESLGAHVELCGKTLAEARQFAMEIVERKDMIFVHPYDDELVVTGQGTVGLELLSDVPDLDAMVVPIGGGGVMAGSAIAAKALVPYIDMIGVEASAFPSMSQALKGEKLESGGATIADGIAVKEPGTVTRPIIEELISDILIVDETALENAVQVFIERQRLVVEGAGAAGLAAVLDNPERFKGMKTGIIVTGGNIDSRILSSILMRGLVREGQLVRLRVHITDAPGVLSTVAGLIGACGGNIIEVYHHRLFRDVPVKEADVDVVVETLDVEHVREITEKLTQAGFGVRLLGDTSLNTEH